MTRFSENTPCWVFPQEHEGQFHKIVGMLEAPLENQWLDGRTVLSWTHLWRHCQWCFHSIYTKIHWHLYFLKVGWAHLSSIFIQKHSKQFLTSFPDHSIPFFWYFISWFKLCAWVEKGVMLKDNDFMTDWRTNPRLKVPGFHSWRVKIEYVVLNSTFLTPDTLMFDVWFPA